MRIPPFYVIITNLFRIIVGVLFTISGFIKINDILGFAYKLEEYFQVLQNHFGIPFTALNEYSIAIAIFISVFEIYLALNLLLGVFRTFTTYMLMLMIIFFTFLTGYSAITHAVHDCGCFGDALKLTPWESFAKDVVLLFMIAYILIYKEEIKPVLPSNAGIIASIFLLLVTLGFTYYTYNYLPVIDFRPYKIGSNLQKNINTIGPDGVPIARDYIPFKIECGFDEFQGKTLIVVIYDIRKIPEGKMKQFFQEAELFKQKNIKVAIGTSALDKELQEFKKKYNPPFCIASQDQTALKTMIRSNPGFIYMEDGIIKKKWSVNSVEDMIGYFKKLK